MNAKLKVSTISILFLSAVLSILLSGVTKATPNPDQTSDAKLSELNGNALQQIKIFQKNELTSNVANRIENELKRIEQTRIKMLGLAEKIKFHQRNIQRLQNELFLKIDKNGQERMLHLQMLMDNKDQIEKTFLNILRIFENIQRDLVANLK